MGAAGVVQTRFPDGEELGPARRETESGIQAHKAAPEAPGLSVKFQKVRMDPHGARSSVQLVSGAVFSAGCSRIRCLDTSCRELA